MLSHSVVSDSLPWTVAHQAPLSMGFFRQEYWSGLPCPSPRDLSDPGIIPVSPWGSSITGRFFTTESPGKPLRDNLGVWNDQIWITIYKIDKQQGCTENYTKYPVINHYEKEYIYMNNWITLLNTRTNTTLWINYILVKKRNEAKDILCED